MASDLGYDIRVAQSTPLFDYPSETKMYTDKWSRTSNGQSTIDLITRPSMLTYFTDTVRAILNGVPLDYYKGETHLQLQAAAIEDPLIYFTDDSIYTSSQNTLTICYANIPHQPFFFNENGDLVEDSANINNWNDKNFYLDQYKYATKLVTNAVSSILKNDPNSIILLMSDHGVRNHSNDSNHVEWMESINVKDITNILCAVYYKGEEFTDIENMCGSNVLISIINKEFGYSIPYIEQSDKLYYKVP